MSTPPILKSSRNSLLIVTAIWLMSAVWFQPTAHAEYVTQSSLKEILQSRDVDALRSALNDIRSQKTIGEIIPLVLDLWRVDRQKYPELPWEIVESDLIRLDVAGILVQANRNGYISVDIEPMHRLARAKLSSTDPMVVLTALGILAYIRDSSDIDVIVIVAEKENRMTFRMSIIAITQMCVKEKRDAALDRLARNLVIENSRRDIEEIRIHFEDIRRPWCRREQVPAAQ